MAAEFFLYTTLYGNTLVNRSNTSFAPLPPETGEIEIDYFIPIIQPLYYYRESGSTIVLNSEETINEYLKGTAPPPEPDDNVLTYTFTGYTGTTDTRLNGMDVDISGNTTGVTANTAAINVSNELIVINYDLITGNTAQINASNELIVINYDLITGNTTGITTNKADISLLADEVAINITDIANNATGITENTAQINASNELIVINYDLITGNTTDITYISGVTDNKHNISDFNSYSASTDTRLDGIDSDVGYLSGVTNTKYNTSDFNSFTGTTLPAGYYNKTQIDVYSGNTLTDINTRVYRSGDTMTGSLSTSGNLTAVGAVTGSSVSAGSCLCSVGTTQLDGGVTAASFLNVSGVTTLDTNIYWNNPNSGGTLNDYGVKWDPVSKQLRTIATTGSSANVYCYAQSAVTENNITTTNVSYLSKSWTLSEGYYESEFNAIFGNTSANRCATVCFLINGEVIGSCNLMKTNAGAVQTTAYVTQNGNLSGGTHTVQIVFRQIGGGISQVHYGAVRVQKIGETI